MAETGSSGQKDPVNKPCYFLNSLPQMWLSGKEAACSAGDPGLVPRSGRSLGEGNGNPLQYSSLENSMDREAWQATVRGIAELGTTEHTQRQG